MFQKRKVNSSSNQNVNEMYVGKIEFPFTTSITYIGALVTLTGTNRSEMILVYVL